MLEKLAIIAAQIKAAEEDETENPGQGDNGTGLGSEDNEKDIPTSEDKEDGKGESDTTDKSASIDGEQLPCTATNNGIFLLIGLFLVGLSFLLFFVRRFKKVKS